MASLPESDQVILSSRVEAIYKEEVAKLGRSPEVFGGKPMRAWEHYEVVRRVGVLDAAVPKGPTEGREEKYSGLRGERGGRNDVWAEAAAKKGACGGPRPTRVLAGKLEGLPEGWSKATGLGVEQVIEVDQGFWAAYGLKVSRGEENGPASGRVKNNGLTESHAEDYGSEDLEDVLGSGGRSVSEGSCSWEDCSMSEGCCCWESWPQ